MKTLKIVFMENTQFQLDTGINFHSNSDNTVWFHLNG